MLDHPLRLLCLTLANFFYILRTDPLRDISDMAVDDVIDTAMKILSIEVAPVLTDSYIA